MAKKGFTPEQIINKLREAEILLNRGATIEIVSKKIGVSDHTYYRWQKDYGGMRHESRAGSPAQRARARECPFKKAVSRSISR